MLDPKLIRETPGAVRAAIAKKHLDDDLDAVLAIDTAWRGQLQEVEGLRSKQKAANTAMAALPKGAPEFVAKVAEMNATGAYRKPIATQVEPARTFWKAEEYHQRYLEKRGMVHCHI